ncbi:MAG: sugar phosphate isomerase/epimerase family protein [Gammaproteobacteria bacterium]
MRNLGIEFLGAFGLSPVELARLAADLDCRFISTVMEPLDYNPEGFGRWSLRTDANLRRELKAALADRNVTLELGEGFAILPGVEARQAFPSDMDLYRDLGVRRINALSFDPDLQRSLDQFAAIAEMANERGMEPVIEFVPISSIGTLALAVKAVRHAGNNARVLIDTMHFFRSGDTIAALAQVSDLVGHVQICDAPAVPTIPDYLEEAMYERRVPGEGDAPLADILAAIPRNISVGLEVPLRTLAEQGVGVRERMARCVNGAREVLGQAELK